MFYRVVKHTETEGGTVAELIWMLENGLSIIQWVSIDISISLVHHISILFFL